MSNSTAELWSSSISKAKKRNLNHRVGLISYQFSSVAQSLFVTPWTAARQASLSIINSWSLLKLKSIESVMPSNHLILYCPLLLPPSIFVYENMSPLLKDLLLFSHSVVSDSATPWTAACQASLSINTSRSLLKLMSIGSVMAFNHLIFCYPLLLLP